MSFQEYAGLAGMGYGGGKEQVSPEDEFFHNVYIAGSTRKNHIQVEEYAGKLQVRGVEYNLSEVHMIITHVKETLVKNVTRQGKDSLECFSYKEPPGGPWVGTTKLPDGRPRPCPPTSAERAANDFCNPCRTHLIVAGLYCRADGSPILREKDGKNEPVFVFIRAKGIKFSNVSSYLNEVANTEFDPLFTPVTNESQEFEKRVVNNKRLVTKVKLGKAKSNYGEKDVYVLEKGVMIPKEITLKMLEMTKKTIPQFSEKFDWSKTKSANQATSSYAGTGVLPIDGAKAQATTAPAPTPQPETKIESPKPVEQPQPTTVEQPKPKVFSFDDIKF